MEQLKQQLINECNQSGLPLEAILFVVRDLFRDVEDTYRRVQQQQAMAAQQQSQEVSDEVAEDAGGKPAEGQEETKE